MDDRAIESALSSSFSKGTEEFRERLLERCLAELGAENITSFGDDGMELTDEQLDAVAGGLLPFKKHEI